jgi:hypothetical protein
MPTRNMLELPSIAAIEFVAAPGNHDCDLLHESDTMQDLLGNVEGLCESGLLPPASGLVKVILAVQQFFSHLNRNLRMGRKSVPTSD